MIPVILHEEFLRQLDYDHCVDWSGCASSSPAYLYVKTNILEKVFI